MVLVAVRTHCSKQAISFSKWASVGNVAGIFLSEIPEKKKGRMRDDSDSTLCRHIYYGW